MKNFTFIGCSITKGVGLDKEELDENNYANIVASNFNVSVNNRSVSGNSNYKIFIDAVNQILFDSPRVLFVQWSSLARHWVYPSPDYHVLLGVQNNRPNDEVLLNTGMTQKQLQRFKDDWLVLNHDYNNILSIMEYVKILEALAKDKCQIIFINGMLPIQKDINHFKHVKQDLSKYLTPYMKSLLRLDVLPDDVIINNYEKLSSKFKEIDHKIWVNLYDSLVQIAIDYGTDNSHPGIESHKKYAAMITSYLNKHYE
jgi:hypothetical protein